MSYRAIRFRLLADLPLEVPFKSITYRLAIARVPASGLWQFEARWPGGHWLCAHADSEHSLRTAIYEEGIVFERATVPWLIFARLVKDGQARRALAQRRSILGTRRSDLRPAG
jgi:hypothetical protein